MDDEEGGGGRKGGRKRKVEVLEYHYERDMEGGYRSCGSMWRPPSKEVLSCQAAAAPMPPVHYLQPPICSSLPLPWLTSPTQLVLRPPTACSLVPALSAARLPASGRGGALLLPDCGCTRHSGARWLAPG